MRTTGIMIRRWDLTTAANNCQEGRKVMYGGAVAVDAGLRHWSGGSGVGGAPWAGEHTGGMMKPPRLVMPQRPQGPLHPLLSGGTVHVTPCNLAASGSRTHTHHTHTSGPGRMKPTCAHHRFHRRCVYCVNTQLFNSREVVDPNPTTAIFFFSTSDFSSPSSIERRE